MGKKTTQFGYVCVLMVLGFSANAQQLHTQANAASIANEANATTGWNQESAVLTSVSGNAQLGAFYLRLTSTASTAPAARRMSYGFNAVVGQQYQIRIWARRGASVSANPQPAFTAWTGVSGMTAQTITGTTWAEYVFTVTATATRPLIRIYSGNTNTQGVAGNAVEIDNVSILPGGPDTTPPTPPTNLSASNITQTSANLTWTAATDNVGVTNYRIYDNGALLTPTGGTGASFLLSGLSASTSYNLTVRALDAAGNESANSNAAAFTTANPPDVPYTTANANLPTVDWSARDIIAHRNLGIGTTDTYGYRLAVAGSAIAESVTVKLHSKWPDFVFTDSYSLPSLEEVELHIEEKGHLIGIPSAAEVIQNGIELGDMNARLLQKIEEMTLYILQLEKRIQISEKENMKMQELWAKVALLEKKSQK